MADEEQQPEQQEEAQQPASTPELDELRAENERMRKHMEELLGESKSAKKKAAELEQAQREAEEARLAEKQEFKTLYEREQEAKRELQEQYETFQQRVQQAEIQAASTAIAGELTRDSKRGALLAEKAASFARHTEDGIQYEMGGVAVDRAKVLEHLTNEYPFLIDGNQSNGGGAVGTKGGGAAASKNPWKAGSLNLTEQARILQEDPQLAAQLQSAAR